MFTPPEKRGRGYARHMMRLLHWVLAPEASLPMVFPGEWGAPPPRVRGAGNAAFSALWSDVGKEFYAGCGVTAAGRDGWVVRDPVSSVWNVRGLGEVEEDGSGEEKGWEWLDEDGVVELWERDAEKIKEDMQELESQGASFVFLPYNGLAAFQHRRQKVFLDRLVPPVEHWGVVSFGKTDLQDKLSLTLADDAIFATWVMDVRPPQPRTLVVTRLRCRVDSFGELLGKVLEISRKHQMEKVEMWNLPKELEGAARTLGGTSFEREEHLPAFKWYGDEEESSVIWLLNEK